MPIEASDNANQVPSYASTGDAFIAESRLVLENSLRKIGHCLEQLTDADLWWRPHESHNSIQNIILHLCGNVRQWIIHGVGGAPDVRDRPEEFAERRPIAKRELLEMLRGTVTEAIAVFATLPPDRLLERRRIQGFDTYVLAAIMDCVSHFVGHTHQIVYVSRMRLGNAYRFQFVPATIEQGAPRPPSR
jgi:hypothetical protein